MTCAHHDLAKGKRRKDGRRRWKCRGCGRSAALKGTLGEADEWAMANLFITIIAKREEKTVREVMES